MTKKSKAKTKSKKPVKKLPYEKLYFYHECKDYIEKKYKVDTDNRNGGYDDSVWLWIVDNHDLQEDGCIIHLPHPDSPEILDVSDNLRELFKLFWKEFGSRKADHVEYWADY